MEDYVYSSEYYPTPETVNEPTIPLTFDIPDNPDIIALILGALGDLTWPQSWYQEGAVTPAEAGERFTRISSSWRIGETMTREIGEVIARAGNVEDGNGWLRCDGRAVSRTTYADLFAAIGTTYGAGDGSTTFHLPDATNRYPLGMTPSGLGSASGGANSITLAEDNLPGSAVINTGANGVAPVGAGAFKLTRKNTTPAVINFQPSYIRFVYLIYTGVL